MMKTKRAYLNLLTIASILLSALAWSAAATATATAETHGRTLYAKPGASGDCLAWGTACDLKTALMYSGSGDEIWAAEGTYYPAPAGNRLATFQLINNLALYGGFAGTETSRAQRDPGAHPTILSGDLEQNGILDSYNAYHVVTGSGTDASAILDGFFIGAGKANGSYPNYLGGGMYNFKGSPTLTDVTFSGNLSAGGGGGMANFSSSPTLTDVTFTGNLSAGGGGAMYNYQSNPTLTDVTFFSNSAANGGGMYNTDSSSPVLTDVTFSGNSASSGSGGGMYNYQSSPTLTDVTFSGNSAISSSGGAIYNYQSSPTLTNVTFSGNSASGEGGGMYNDSTSTATLINSILWGNTAPAGSQISGSATVTYSDIQGGWTGFGNIDSDPLFVDAASGNLRLQVTSPAIDAGNDTAVTGVTTDLDGSQRSVDIPGKGTALVDMGAYDTQLSLPVIYVDQDSAGPLRDGTSWTKALTSLQSALAAANGNNEIWVAEGIYYPVSFWNRLATFQLKNNVALYGGFTGTETSRDQRNPADHLTTLSGDLDRNGTRDDGNAYHVVTGSGTGASAILNGFTVTGGNANGGNLNDLGGGMYNDTGSPTLTDMTFSGNSARYGGGGMSNDSGSPTLTDVTFSANSAGYYGGGMYNGFSSPTLTNVTFSRNSAEDGGGMVNFVGSPTLTNVAFSANSATSKGGGMSNTEGSPTLTDVTFSANTASGGGGMSNDVSSPTLTNVTFSSNSASGGGGMYNYYHSDPTLTDVIFSSNSAASSGGGMFNDGTSSPTLKDVTFFANSAYDGGGMWNNYQSSPTLTDVAFSGNSAAGRGGGMLNNYQSSPTLMDVTFLANSAYNGGGMSNEVSSSPTLTDVTFSANSATWYGGGMYNGFSSPTLTNVTFSGNSVSSYGGGMENSQSSPTLTDVTFSGNSAANGGGMRNNYQSSPTLINVTFSANSAASSGGGGMYNDATSTATLINSILWGNTPTDQQIYGGATITYSDIQGGWSGAGNIDADPLLGPLTDNGGFTLTHNLRPGSPAIDAGSPDPASCPTTDQRGVARPIDGDRKNGARCDMGAVEFLPKVVFLPLVRR